MADNEELGLGQEQEDIQQEDQIDEEMLLEPAENEEAAVPELAAAEDTSIINNEDSAIALDSEALDITADSTVDENNTGEEEQKPKDENEQDDKNEETVDNEEADADGEANAEGKDDDGKDLGDEEEDDEEDDDADEDDTDEKFDPNVMPQVNVAVLAKRRWQVKVYPLKPNDFTSGLIARVFKCARESLLYLMQGKQPRGKGEMYIQSVTESMRVVRNLMTLDSHFPDINIEVIRKNNEGVVLEKAYMRFDTKMVRMLFVNMPPVPPRSQGRLYGKGRKRERVIGSVFVKNLPPNTTKNMLRVMFPFAQEINYNPEKYTDGTARLVLKTRSTVIPCLKAFAKVELGGNVLELHPLERNEKKKKLPPSKEEREKRKAAKDKKTDSSGEEKSETDQAKTEDEKDEESKKEPGTPKSEEDKETPKKKPSSASKKDGEFKTPEPKGKEKNPKAQQRRGPSGGSRPGSGKPRLGNGKSPAGREGFQRNRDGRKTFGDNRAGARRQGAGGNRFSGNRAGAGGIRSSSFSGGNRSFGAGMRRGSRGPGDRRMSGGVGVGTELLEKAAATKDMMVLQSQLNMAIKSQLAMLNQTKMAVEQAKRGASSIGMANSLVGGASGLSHMSDVGSRRDSGDRAYGGRNRSRENRASLGGAGNWGYGKRSAEQAELGEGYGEKPGYGRKRAGGKGRGGRGGRGGGGGGAGHYAQTSRAMGADRGALGGYDDDLYRQDNYSMRDQADDYAGYSLTGRFGGGAGLSSGRSDYDNDSYGYRY